MSQRIDQIAQVIEHPEAVVFRRAADTNAQHAARAVLITLHMTVQADEAREQRPRVFDIALVALVALLLGLWIGAVFL